MRNSKRTNNIFFICELCFYGISFVSFLILNFFEVPLIIANIIYILFISFNFIYLFLLGNVFTKLDPAVHYKQSSVHYKNRDSKQPTKKRKLLGVILLWIVYLIFIGTLSCFSLLTWQLFLCGASIMFSLNTIFSRKKCLLSILFLHNKNNCCMNCAINGWDLAIFASSLIFVPFLSPASVIVNICILLLSATDFIIWEYNYHKHPYRFFPETNKNLGCANCIKSCKRKSNSKDKENRVATLV